MLQSAGTTSAPNDCPRQAREMLETWESRLRTHLSGGAGCSCGLGGLSLQVSDFELDIVEFVINDARKEARASLVSFVDAVTARGPDRYSLAALLDSIERGEHPLLPSEIDLQFALDRLRLTLTSLEAAHPRNRFVCD